MKAYNTMSRQEEVFEPRHPPNVNVYVCGLTTYDLPHIGHARTYIAFEVILRWLKRRDYKVKYVQNVTDVDDKIINRAAKEGKKPLELARHYHEEALKDFDALGVARADLYPKASENIDEIIGMVKRLVDNGHAYVRGADVYFDVSSFPEYGALSHQDLDKMLAGARKDVAENKDDVLDFALWKAAKPGEISWPSPWGAGRPGWHIECSVMSLKYLDGVDVHGGAIDLIFPHHENEIAQSRAAGDEFVKYWWHTGFLNVGGEKMSKSLGNFITIRDLLAKADAEAFRFMIASAHYRSRVDFTWEGLEEEGKALKRLYSTIEAIDSTLLFNAEAGHDAGLDAAVEQAVHDFEAAMDNDFSTPEAVAALFDLSKKVNEYLDNGGKKKKSLENARAAFTGLGGVLNVLQNPLVLSEEQTALILEREEARQKKDFAASDAIRDRLLNQGVALLDSKTGVRYRRA